MINWDDTYKTHGFKSEVQMWRTLLVSLRNNKAIAKYLGVSQGSVQRRRQLLNLHKSSRRGGSYRRADKKMILDKVPDSMWTATLEDIKLYVREEFDTDISLAYILKYRKKQGL